jgi:GTPase SAR1 family protein
MPLTQAQVNLLQGKQFVSDEFGEDFKYLKAVLFGDPGVGKSTLAAAFGETLFLAADPGWVSTQNHVNLKGHVTPMQYRGYQHFNAMTIAVYEKLDLGETNFKKFDTIVIDTLDEIVADVVDSLVIGFERGRGSDRPDFTPRQGALSERQTLPSFDLPGRTDYHAARNLLRGPLRRLMAAQVNVIILTHEREPSEEEMKKKDTIKTTRPSLTDGIYKVVSNHTHVLGHMERDADSRTITFLKDKRNAAKSRIYALDGKKIPTEDFPKYVARWQGLDPDYYVTDFRTK